MNPTPRLRSQVNIWSQLIAVSLILGMVSLTGFSPVLAQQQQRSKTLTVTGEGVVSIPTTLTQVSLGVEVQGETAVEVQQELARRSSAVVALLRSRNVQKLQTTAINLNRTYSSQGDVRRPTGFVGSNVVTFQIDTNLSGQLLDEVVRAGATRINGISFVASDQVIAVARKQAIRAATQDAQEQADAALGALNFTRREIVSIQINANRPFIGNNSSFAAGDAFVATPVVGGEQQVRASVTLQITY